MSRIKRDKPSSGRVKQPEEATDAVASNARPEAITVHSYSPAEMSDMVKAQKPEAQILRLVPKVPAFSPWEMYISALREYQIQWLKVWASFLPR